MQDRAYVPQAPFHTTFISKDDDGYGTRGGLHLNGDDLEALKRRVRSEAKNPATAPGVYLIHDDCGVPCASFDAWDREVPVHDMVPSDEGLYFNRDEVRRATQAGRVKPTEFGGFIRKDRNGVAYWQVYTMAYRSREAAAAALREGGLKSYDLVQTGRAIKREVQGSNLSWAR